ncbi:MAG: hypothetical protein ACRD1X_12410 [Vicinamibacteria bacterium]
MTDSVDARPPGNGNGSDPDHALPSTGPAGAPAGVPSETPAGAPEPLVVIERTEAGTFPAGVSGNPSGPAVRPVSRRDEARTKFLEGFVDWFLGNFRAYASKRVMKIAHQHYAELWNRAKRNDAVFNHLLDKLMESATPPAAIKAMVDARDQSTHHEQTSSVTVNALNDRLAEFRDAGALDPLCDVIDRLAERRRVAGTPGNGSH